VLASSVKPMSFAGLALALVFTPRGDVSGSNQFGGLVSADDPQSFESWLKRPVRRFP